MFIARTLLERTGATVSFNNRVFPDHGAVVQIAWPRNLFEAEDGGETPAAKGALLETGAAAADSREESAPHA